MSVFGAGAFLDLLLSRGRMVALVSVPDWWSMTVFLLAEEGWRYALVPGFVLPLFVAYVGLWRGSRAAKVRYHRRPEATPHARQMAPHA